MKRRENEEKVGKGSEIKEKEGKSSEKERK